jgi:ESCRT-II complex subunit VPS36
LTCGIKPPFSHIIKAAIAAAVPNRGTSQVKQQSSETSPFAPYSAIEHEVVENVPSSGTSVTCPRCTFHNHPSLLACEVCGAPLLSSESLRSTGDNSSIAREESPGPRLDRSSIDEATEPESIKFSFRAGGEKIFHERLKGALIQRKWLLRNAPPIPKPLKSPSPERDESKPNPLRGSSSRPQSTSVGIAGLEQRGLQSRKNNEFVIGNAFEDLEALMASAKDIVALAERFASETGQDTGGGSAQANDVFSESAAALGMVTTKDLLGGTSDGLYVSELSRNLAEYLTDDRKGVLKGEGGIMSLVDLWAVFNRSRNGVELVSPSDFERAARLWEELRLPVRLRRFRSGLLVVQRSDWNDEKVVGQLKTWLQELHNSPSSAVGVDWTRFGQGVTAQEAARRFGWSVGVAGEELEMAEEKGVLCREEGIEGLKFWGNHLLEDRAH